MDLAAIRRDLVDVATEGGFHAYPVQQPVMKVPAVVVGPADEVTYHKTLAGGADVTIPVTVICQGANLEDIQAQVDRFMSTAFAELFSTSRPSWRVCRVARAGQVREITNEQAVYTGFDLTLEIFAR